MPLVDVAPEEVQQKREVIMIYGAAGSGKTRLATSLPERFGEIVYVALDEGSEGLDTVLPQYRSRIHVVRPTWEDPMVDAAEIVSTDWQKKWPGVKTIVIDTFSNLSWKLLAHIANKGMFSKNHVEIGAANSPLKQALPDRGDYGAVHAVVRNLVTALINQQRKLNIIVICHQDTDKDEQAGTVGGPATVGRAMIEWLPGRFKTVIRLDRETERSIAQGKVSERSKYIARTSPHGAWIARINESSATGNPVQSVEVAIDARNFWDVYASKLGIKEEV